MENKVVTLIGDSIIDNMSYVEPPGLCVLGHLDKLKPNWTFEQRAVDGHTTVNVLESQLIKKNDSPTVLSIGGNDLLKRMDLLTSQETLTAAELFEELHRELVEFEIRHSSILDKIRGPALICTIYNPSFKRDNELAPLQKSAEIAVGLFNDVIQRNSAASQHQTLELRNIFLDAVDYANPIEPSDIGGKKLAENIIRWVDSLN